MKISKFFNFLKNSEASASQWPFDQAKNVAALTTHRVVHEKYPVLSVTHYNDDDSWAFTCGTTTETEDAMFVSMESIVSIDPTLRSIADLAPGWSAYRDSIGGSWNRVKDEDVD
jgi:hypothetical protein